MKEADFSPQLDTPESIADAISAARHKIMVSISGVNAAKELHCDPEPYLERYREGMRLLTSIEASLRTPKRRLRVVAGRG